MSAMSAMLPLPCVWAVAPSLVRKRAELPEPVIPVAFYRKHTEALLRRYMHLSMEMGRRHPPWETACSGAGYQLTKCAASRTL